jgi:predicted acetyltransferase
MIYLEKVNMDDAEKIIEVRRLAYTDEDIRFGEGRGGYLKYIGNIDFISWCVNRYLLYKIMLDGEIIGTFWLDHETDDRPDHFELQDFCIIPRHQNKGYGVRAIKLMEKLHENIKIWSLSTAIFSTRNQHLYEKMGYKQIGQTENDVLYEKIIGVDYE